MILVVSKDREIRETLARALGAAGEPVEAVTSTRAALRRVEHARVTVVDLLTDGLDARPLKGRPVVVVGVYEDEPTIIGPDRILKKFTVERLKEAVSAPAA